MKNLLKNVRARCTLILLTFMFLSWNKKIPIYFISRDVLLETIKPKTDDLYYKCGDVCNTDIRGKPGKYFDVISKRFDCPILFRESFDLQFQSEIPQIKIPESLKDKYTYKGRIPIDYYYMDDVSVRQLPFIYWSAKQIEAWRRRLRQNDLMFGSYAFLHVRQEIWNALQTHFNGGKANALVIGSQEPWIETMALEAGFHIVWTLEYRVIKCDHKQIRTILPSEMDNAFLNGSLPQFDAIISFSSLEHSGLGRYGDPLNPFGDLITMAKAWCMAKPGGRALIGVPTGRDLVCFNAHKFYGQLQFSHLFANWEQVHSNVNNTVFHKSITRGSNGTCDKEYGYQPVHIVQKPAIL